MSNFANHSNNYININTNSNPKKYDSKNLSSNNINFILLPKKFQTAKKENIIKDNEDEINTTDKIISFNYSQSKPYYKYSHIYTISNDSKYNFTYSLGNIKNDIKIQNEKNNEINIKSCMDNNCGCYIKKNINDFCFACKRNYENQQIKKMLQDMFQGQEVETFTKSVHIRTFNSPSKNNKFNTKKQESIINFSSIKNNIEEENQKKRDDII